MIVIIDCGAGNLHSVRKALLHVAGNVPVMVTQRAEDLAGATHVVLPGVGAFGDCMAGLQALPQMREALEEAVLKNKTPFLGICVGMQMLFQRGHEHGTHAGLGWFEGEVKKLAPRDAALRIPHMGWNTLHIHAKEHPVLKSIPAHAMAYFVHSYHAVGAQPNEVLASVDYGGDVVAIIGRENILATQFHPEKSQKVGLGLLHHFITMKA